MKYFAYLNECECLADRLYLCVILEQRDVLLSGFLIEYEMN